MKMSAWGRTWQLCSTMDKTKFESLKLDWAELPSLYSKLIPSIHLRKKVLDRSQIKWIWKGNLQLQTPKKAENNTKDGDILNGPLIARLEENYLEKI